MSQQTDTIDLLDRTLPAELIGVIAPPAQAVASGPTENEKMPEATIQTVTPEAIKAAASAVVQDILKSDNREQAIAVQIGALTEAKVKAEASVVELTGKLATATDTATGLQTKLDAALADATAKGEANVKLQADFDKLKAELATANSTIAAAAKVAAKAARAEMVAKADVSDAIKTKLVARAEAVNEAGEFAYSEAQLKELISDAVDTYAAGKATAPAPATGDSTTTTTEAPASATASANGNVTPIEPDFTQGSSYAQSVAQLLTPAKASASGVSTFASNFGSGSAK